MAPSVERSLKRAAASHSSWARTVDRTARTEPGRRAMNQRFENQVDPDGVLDPRERAIRAEHGRRAYYLAMAARSVESRRRKAAARKAAAENGGEPSTRT